MRQYRALSRGQGTSIVGLYSSGCIIDMYGSDLRQAQLGHAVKHLIRTLRKIYGQSFAAGYPETEKLSEVLLKLNETSFSQLSRDHETGHLEHKIANASK
jgi:hypothetical protein